MSKTWDEFSAERDEEDGRASQHDIEDAFRILSMPLVALLDHLVVTRRINIGQATEILQVSSGCSIGGPASKAAAILLKNLEEGLVARHKPNKTDL